VIDGINGTRVGVLSVSLLTLALAACGGGGGDSDSGNPPVVPGTNSAPTIAGNPATTVGVGQAYSFQPSANDANNDTLTFSITNAPSWATFNSQTGRLSGTPTAANVGTTSGIVISVSDNKVSSPVAMASFSITVSQSGNGAVTLDWTPPNTNTDGSALTNLSGYRIIYGTSPSALTQQINITNPSVSSYVVDGLTANTWYFSVKSVDGAGMESAPSNPVSKQVM
jgi:hypothetical protein